MLHSVAQAAEDFSLAHAQLVYADCYLTPIATDGPLLTTDALLPAQQVSRLTATADRTRAPDAQLILPVLSEASSSDRVGLPVTEAASPSSASPADGAQDTAETDSTAPAERAPRLRPQLARRRASDSPFIAVALSEYLRIARTLAARIVMNRSAPPAMHAEEQDSLDDTVLHDTLTRWGLNPTVWLAQLHQLDRRCTRALGAADRVLQRAQSVAQQQFQGVSFCRALFAAAPSDGFT